MCESAEFLSILIIGPVAAIAYSALFPRKRDRFNPVFTLLSKSVPPRKPQSPFLCVPVVSLTTSGDLLLIPTRFKAIPANPLLSVQG